ncbi:MAG: ribonuclease P protein component [Bdellovibrionaceae bacterium]|nr:ribonuclease P protein component [Pseudobdellovibrionaceae bacterium]
MASKARLSVLRHRSDFLNLSKNGHRVRAGGWLVVNFLPNAFGHVRCGWTLPGKIGNAVVRNRLKRWSRVYLRERMEALGPLAVDVNLVFLKSDGDFYKKLDYDEFSKNLDKAWALLRKRL